MAQYVEYRHNNSGGVDWMKTEDWENLQKAGWIVSATGARIHSASRPELSLQDAIAEWEEITGMNAAEDGCNCCGRPHDFTLYGPGDQPIAEMVIVRQPNTWKVEEIKW